MQKLHTSKIFLKMAKGIMHTSHPIPLNRPLAISYGNHHKSLAYFSEINTFTNVDLANVFVLARTVIPNLFVFVTPFKNFCRYRDPHLDFFLNA